MPVLFFVSYRPEAARERNDWVFRYGQLEGRSEDPLDARQKLTRAIHADPYGILRNMRSAVGGGEAVMQLSLDYDALPIGRMDEAALLRIDYGLLQRGDTWICAGAGDRRTYRQDPLDAKQALVGEVYRTAQQLVNQEGLAALVAEPIRAGVTNARMIDLSEGKIEGHMGGLIVKVENR